MKINFKEPFVYIIGITVIALILAIGQGVWIQCHSVYHSKIKTLEKIEFQTIGEGGIFGGTVNYTVFKFNDGSKIKLHGTFNNMIENKECIVKYKNDRVINVTQR